MSKPLDLVSAIRSVAAGMSVDWSALGSAPADASVADMLDQLKVIATIADINGPAADDRSSFEAGDDELQSWGPLTLIERIGGGSYGVVYRAWDSRLDREVALKLLRPGRSQQSDTPTIDEGRLLARVRHSNVVTVYGADRIADRVGIWMEFVSGRTLDAIIQSDGPLSPEAAARIGIEVAKGLGAVHRAGIVHRDVKAQNVMVQDDGRVVLMDFGSGHTVDEIRGNVAAGTPLYVAPEVLSGGPATVRSDIYSLGVLLYHGVTGAYPRTGSNVAELISDSGPTASMRLLYPGLPMALSTTIDRALAAESSRFQSAEELEHALVGRRQLSGLLLTTAAVVLIAAAATAGVFWRSTRAQAGAAQPARHHWVLIGTVENNTDDPALGETVRSTLLRAFEQSPTVSSVPQARVTEALALMRRSQDSPLDVELAKEVALRDGDVDTIVTGRVDRVGNGVVLSAEAINPFDGSSMASVAEPQLPVSQLPSAIQREASRIETALATETGVTARSGVRLRKVTSPSLRAVELYSEAASLYPDEGENWDHVAVQKRLESALAEDPDFASAHILLSYAIANQLPNCQSCPAANPVRVHAERAMQLAGTVTSVERHFIEGSGHWFRARFTTTRAQRDAEELAAIAGWEAVIREQPDFPWILRNIESAYRQLGYRADIAIELASLADAFPDSFRLSAAGALAARYAGDDAAMDRLSARAERLMTADQEHAYGERAADIKLLVIHRAWLHDNPQAMLDRLKALSRESERSEMASARQWVTMNGFEIALTLGRLHDAEVYAAQFKGGSLHDVAFTKLLKQRRDRAGLRAFLSTRLGSAPNLAGSFAENGFLDEAERIVRFEAAAGAPTDSVGVLPLEESIALQEGRLEDALRLGEDVLHRTSPGDYRHISVSMMNADALVQLGRAGDGIALLEASTARRPAAFESGYRWMDARAQLATLYHQAGREAEARAVEDQLLKLLAVADEDHPLLLELKSRLAARTDAWGRGQSH